MCQARGISRSGGSHAGLASWRSLETPSSWSTVATARVRRSPGARYAGRGSRVLRISRGTSPGGEVQVSVKRNSVLARRWWLLLALSSSAAATADLAGRRGHSAHHPSRAMAVGDRVASPRRRRRAAFAWSTAGIRSSCGSIWIDVSTIVSLVREPDVPLFYVSEQSRPRRTRATGATGVAACHEPLDAGALHSWRTATTARARQAGQPDWHGRGPRTTS